MDEQNPLFQLLSGLVETPPTFYYRNKFYALNDPKLPTKAGATFVRGQITALLAAVKEAETPTTAA